MGTGSLAPSKSGKQKETESVKGPWAQICTYAGQENSICFSTLHSYMPLGKSQKLTQTAGKAMHEPPLGGHTLGCCSSGDVIALARSSPLLPRPVNTDPHLWANRCGQLEVIHLWIGSDCFPAYETNWPLEGSIPGCYFSNCVTLVKLLKLSEPLSRAQKWWLFIAATGDARSQVR